MNLLVVDDEQFMLDDIVSILKKIDIVDTIYSFSDPREALKCAKEHQVDVALLDMKMYGIHGIEMARQLKQNDPDIYIIFLTAFSSYAYEAFQIHARGYIMKPTSQEEIERELILAEGELNLKRNRKGGINRVKDGKSQRIWVQTFGYFEVFLDNHPIEFQSTKSKELLAFLVDRRGAEVTIGELAEVLWEDHENDKNTKSYVRRAISKLVADLRENHCIDMLKKTRNNICVIPEVFDCDYYEFIQGNIDAINGFTGEYMSNYSWAEFTTGFLENKMKTKAMR